MGLSVANCIISRGACVFYFLVALYEDYSSWFANVGFNLTVVFMKVLIYKKNVLY